MSNSILPAAGNLDIVNANVRADKFNAATNIGVANTNPDFNFSVGDKFHVDKDSTDPVSITGNVVASGIKISNLTIGPAFDFASVSNVGNVTANVIQFANATTGFTTTANVEIGGNISLTSNAQVKVGSNVLAEYTGPHGREPTTPLLKKFPEIVFDASKYDQNHSTNTYIQAGYTVTASSQATDAKNAANLYNEQFPTLINTDDGWQSRNNTYDGSTGVAASIDTLTGITGATSSRNGSYTTLELPHKIKLSYLQIHTRNSVDHGTPVHPKQVYVYGSNDGSSWTQVGSHLFTSVPSSPIWQRIDINSTTPYKYFVLQTTSILPFLDTSLNRVYILDLEWYGYEEDPPQGDLSLDTTLKSTFNSVRSNNYVMYFDGKDPDGTDPKNLVSGSSISLTNNNATYDASNDYWTLDGSTESNVTTGSLGFEGDAPHTVSMWVNASNLEANALTQQLFTIGSGYDKSFLEVDDTQIAANTWHNVTYAYQGEGGSKVTYVDGRKVEEAQVEDTFGDYPPFAMTDYETGGYRVSASSEFLGVNYAPAYRAFDKNTNPDDPYRWVCGDNRYNTDGSYAGSESHTDIDGNVEQGEWLKIELPHKLKVGYFEIAPYPINGSQSLRNYAILGSNDDINWYQVQKVSGLAAGLGLTAGSVVPTGTYKNSAFKYFVFIWSNKDADANKHVSMGELKLYGHKEGDLTRFPEPTRVLKYPHVAMTGYAQRGYTVTASNETLADGNRVWHVFDENDSTFWKSDERYTSAGVENTSSGLTDTSSTAHGGEYVVLESPNKLNITGFNLTRDGGNTARSPGSIAFLGKNSAPTVTTGWTLIAQQTTSTYTNDVAPLTISGNSNYFKYHAVVIRSIDGNGLRFHIKNIELLGTQEDTQTPAIVGGPFAGKVANFRVYDQYLGDERIQEIYDAQKDEFGHKKSSMTFYEGRIGVGTTEPEGALTVVDEPHTLAKFPARAVSADESYVEGDGQIKLSAADGSGYQAFDGLTSTSWDSTPTRNTRVSEEVDFGAWLKIQTPESMSLKKARIESVPSWEQVGADVDGPGLSGNFGRAIACSHDGTRVIAGGKNYNSSQGIVQVYDWNGSAWTQVGNTLTGDSTSPADGQYGRAVAISGDGNIIAVAAPYEHVSGYVDKGTVRVYYLSGNTWTILPDSGSLTETTAGFVDVFVGSGATMYLGMGRVQLSYDGKTLAMHEYNYEGPGGELNAGRVLVYQYSNGAWSYKGTGATQFVGSAANVHFGFGLSMSEDGNHLALGTLDAGYFVEVYTWDGSAWGQKGLRLNEPSSGSTQFGAAVSISNDGNTLAVGIRDADVADGALATNGGLVHVYHWTGSAWGTPYKLTYNEAVDEDFGAIVELSGDGKRLIVGADDENSNQGEVFTFEYTGASWVLRTPGTIGADGGSNGYLGLGPAAGGGHSIALSRDGSTIAGGELGHDSSNGRFRVFSMPSNIKSIWGSNDDVNWTKITTAPTREEATSNVAGLAFGYDDRLEFKNLDNPNYYKYHAIVADAFTRLKDVKLFGVRKQGSSTLHDGTLTLTKNLDVPRIGPPPDADDTPRRDRLVVEYNTHKNPLEDGVVRDSSGRGNDGAFYGGASYSASAKAFEFDGSGDYTRSGILTNMSGDKAVSYSVWIKAATLVTTMIVALGEAGVYGTNGKTGGIFMGTNGTLYNTVFGNGIQVSGAITTGKWIHIVATKIPGGSGIDTQTLYVNGLKPSQSNWGTPGTSLSLDDPVITLGASPTLSQYFNGSISNFKLYDVALTAQEVKTLYDMGRCSNAIPKTLHIMGGMMRYNNDIGKLQIHNGDRWSTIGGTRASGGTRLTFGDYALHVFTESGTFSMEHSGYVDILIVAGGGSGGNVSNGGGGGAGGLRLAQDYLLNGGSYTVTVGAGGAEGSSGAGNDGSASSFGTISTQGGGGGGDYGQSGRNGGSGGGGGAYIGSTSGGSGQQSDTSDGLFIGYGNNGGNTSGTTDNRAGGGGGGAGGAGATNSGSTPGIGGLGLDLSATFGTNVGELGYFASGGYGQSRQDTNRIYPGPLGGGGGNNDDRSGLPNTGGGAHGGNGGGNGGSGVVIIRYL